MSPVGDRRSHVRFDVVGALWGLLEMNEAARIRNVSTTGALIESPVPVALGSTQTIRVTVDGEPVTVDTRVRHVRRADGRNVTDISAAPFLIGVEFISPPWSVVQSIEELGSPKDLRT